MARGVRGSHDFTETDRLTLAFLLAFLVENQRAPTLREAAAAFGLQYSAINRRVIRLERHGLVAKRSDRTGCRTNLFILGGHLVWIDD